MGPSQAPNYSFDPVVRNVASTPYGEHSCVQGISAPIPGNRGNNLTQQFPVGSGNYHNQNNGPADMFYQEHLLMRGVQGMTSNRTDMRIGPSNPISHNQSFGHDNRHQVLNAHNSTNIGFTALPPQSAPNNSSMGIGNISTQQHAMINITRGHSGVTNIDVLANAALNHNLQPSNGVPHGRSAAPPVALTGGSLANTAVGLNQTSALVKDALLCYPSMKTPHNLPSISLEQAESSNRATVNNPKSASMAHYKAIHSNQITPQFISTKSVELVVVNPDDEGKKTKKAIKRERKINCNQTKLKKSGNKSKKGDKRLKKEKKEKAKKGGTKKTVVSVNKRMSGAKQLTETNEKGRLDFLSPSPSPSPPSTTTQSVTSQQSISNEASAHIQKAVEGKPDVTVDESQPHGHCQKQCAESFPTPVSTHGFTPKEPISNESSTQKDQMLMMDEPDLPAEDSEQIEHSGKQHAEPNEELLPSNIPTPTAQSTFSVGVSSETNQQTLSSKAPLEVGVAKQSEVDAAKQSMLLSKTQTSQSEKEMPVLHTSISSSNQSTSKQESAEMDESMAPSVTDEVTKQSKLRMERVAESKNESHLLQMHSQTSGSTPKKQNSKKSKSKKPLADNSPQIFQCPKCLQKLCYTHRMTAKASFCNHVRRCGQAKKGKTVSKKSPAGRPPARRKKSTPNSEVNENEKLLKRGEQIKVEGSIERQDREFHVHLRKRKRDCDSASETPREIHAVSPLSRKVSKASNMESVSNNEGGTKDGKITPTVETAVTRSKICKSDTTAQTSYPYAPLGHLWLKKSLNSSKSRLKDANMDMTNLNAGGTLIGRRWAWDEGYFVDSHFDPQLKKKGRELEASLLKRGCICGCHSHMLVETKKSSKSNNDGKSNGRARRSDRSANAYSSIVSTKLADGSLDPHTLIAPEDYAMGPEFRFIENAQTEHVQPFLVRINPDATFLADLHAHLCNSEIIGLLGGHYSKDEKCIYIQAAFPCKSTDRTDSGQTDVEMDPVGQIHATEAIANHGMSVVGWYHSHPDFQPNPSITDIENQASYQQLFQGNNPGKNDNRIEYVSPFVGLIVGTYDGKNPSSQSVMRWFHCRRKDTAENRSVNFPMNLKTTNRHFRKMKFDERVTTDNIRQSMTLRGTNIRQVLESRYLSCPILGVHNPVIRNAMKNDVGQQQTGDLCVQNASTIKDNFEITQTDDSMSASIFNQDTCGQDKTNTSAKSSLSLMESHESPLLLSESLLSQRMMAESKRVWEFQSARPLYFTQYERSILHDNVPDNVIAGIIWFAVEREQQVLQKSDANENSMTPPGIPASSRSILELLLRQAILPKRKLHQKIYSMIHCLNDNELSTLNESFDDNDSVILHSVDVVLGHYAPKSNRINPFSSWTGAGDKGKISKDDRRSGSDPLFFDFYFTKILQMKSVQTDEGQVYEGGIRMKRGHKIAACLLKWARNMQLDSDINKVASRAIFPLGNSEFGGLSFDHEQKLRSEFNVTDAQSPQNSQYIFFVSEVMRLMAARWRECGAKATKQCVYKKRGRPPKRLPSY